MTTVAGILSSHSGGTHVSLAFERLIGHATALLQEGNNLIKHRIKVYPPFTSFQKMSGNVIYKL
jgi:hypothetical protein